MAASLPASPLQVPRSSTIAGPLQAAIIVNGERRRAISSAGSGSAVSSVERPALSIRTPARLSTRSRRASFGSRLPPKLVESNAQQHAVREGRRATAPPEGLQRVKLSPPASSGTPSSAISFGYAARSCCGQLCRPCLRLAIRLAGHDEQDRDAFDLDVMAHEAQSWWALAWPLGVTAAARLSLVVMDLAFVGHLGTEELAGASLAGVWVDVVSGWVWPSFGAAVNTLSAQAIGAKRPALAGVWLQTGLVLSAIAAVPVVVALLLAENLFTAFGFGSVEAGFAGRFCSWIALGVLPAFWYTVVAAFLKAQGDVTAAMSISLAMVVVNAGLNIFFIHGTTWFQSHADTGVWWEGLGFDGSPIATATTRWLSLLALALYIATARLATPPQRTPNQHSKAAVLSDSKPAGRSSRRRHAAAAYCCRSCSCSCCCCCCGDHGDSLRSTCTGPRCCEAMSPGRMWELGWQFALPLAMSNLLEELQLQVIAFLAAQLGPAELAAHNSMLAIFFFCSSAMYSAVGATTTRVAHHLGAGRVRRARAVMWLDVQFSVCAAVIVAGAIGGAGGNLARVFSSDAEVIDAVGRLSVLVGCAYAFLCLFFCSVAVLQAMGKTTAVATAFVTGAWLVAVPAALLFDRVLHLGLEGLWYGLTAGYSVVTLIAVIFTVRADWRKASVAAIERSTREKKKKKKKTTTANQQEPITDDDDDSRDGGAGVLAGRTRKLGRSRRRHADAKAAVSGAAAAQAEELTVPLLEVGGAASSGFGLGSQPPPFSLN